MQKKILLIVENRQLRKRFSEFLDEMGYFVKTTQDISSALAMCHMLQPDMILCDSAFPGFSGERIVRNFKEDHGLENSLLVLITHKIPSQRECDFVNSGCRADDYLTPPHEWISLYNIVSKWLETDKQTARVIQKSSSPKHPAMKSKPIVKAPTLVRSSNHWHKGKVDVLSISRLFWNLSAHDSTGILNITRKNQVKIHINSGKIIDVFSTFIPSDSLGRYLISQKVITTRENKVSFKAAKKLKILQGQALLRFNLIDKQDLATYLTQHKSMKVLRLFQKQWKDGQYEFTVDKISNNLQGMQPIAFANALKMGIINIADFDELYDVFSKRNKIHLPIQLTDKFDSISNRLSLETNIREIAKRNGMKSLKEIETVLADEFEIFLRYYFLLIISKAAKFSLSRRPKQPDTSFLSAKAIDQMLSSAIPTTTANIN